MITIDLVALPDVDRAWAMIADRVAHCLRKAPMELSAGDIWANCRSGQWLLIIAHDGPRVCGTSIWRFAGNGYFDCVLLTGEAMREWAPQLIETAKKIAVPHGCRGLSATGRPTLIHEIKKTLPRTKVVRHTFASEF